MALPHFFLSEIDYPTFALFPLARRWLTSLATAVIPILAITSTFPAVALRVPIAMPVTSVPIRVFFFRTITDRCPSRVSLLRSRLFDSVSSVRGLIHAAGTLAHRGRRRQSHLHRSSRVSSRRRFPTSIRFVESTLYTLLLAVLLLTLRVTHLPVIVCFRIIRAAASTGFLLRGSVT